METARIKQTLVNNGFSNSDFDRRLNHFINSKFDKQTARQEVVTHTLFYKNQMSLAYKTDERVLHSILTQNTQCVQLTDRLQLVVYYKNKKTSNLIMKNNLNSGKEDLRSTSVVYQYTCHLGDCGLHPAHYIGETVSTLSRRITSHLQVGAPKKHTIDEHDTTLTRSLMVDNTKIIYRASDSIRLKIAESLLIGQLHPVINYQDTGIARTLRLFSTRYQPPAPPVT
jgi:hypothetical protein